MDSALARDYTTLIDELTQGMEKAMQLRLRLCSTSLSQDHDFLVQTILSTFEKALLTLRWRESIRQPQVGPPTPTAPDSSSVSVDASPKSENTKTNFKDRSNSRDNTSKKRKLQPTWTEQVRVDCGNGLDGPQDDGYSWRKYGQKDILGAKYPRSYYRCTNRVARDCWATKQVQRSDNDPTVFEIIYKGIHACNDSINAVPPPPATLEIQELKHKNCHDHHQLEQHNQTLSNFKANLRVDTDDLDIEEMAAHFFFPSNVDDNYLGEHSPLFYSPDTSESNYFSEGTFRKKNYGGTSIRDSETYVGNIISTHASTTNSPTGGMEFSIDPVDLDPNFPFNTLGFFT